MKRSALALLALIAALFLPASAAFASDNANDVGLFANNYQCNGASNLATSVGSVNLHQDGTTVTAIVHFKEAAPNNTYVLYAYTGFCSYTGASTEIDTNSNGVGNGTFTYQSPAGNPTFIIGFDIAPYTGSFFDSLSATP